MSFLLGPFVQGMFQGADSMGKIIDSYYKTRSDYLLAKGAQEAEEASRYQGQYGAPLGQGGGGNAPDVSKFNFPGSQPAGGTGGGVGDLGDPNKFYGMDAAPGSTVGQGVGYNNPKAERIAYYKQYMLSKGLNPDALIPWINSEGLNRFGGDFDEQGNPTSFGDFQLNNKYMGLDAIKAGIDITNPNNWQAMGRFAIDQAAAHKGDVNWFNSQWHGPANVSGTRIGSLLYSPYSGGPIAPYQPTALGGGSSVAPAPSGQATPTPAPGATTTQTTTDAEGNTVPVATAAIPPAVSTPPAQPQPMSVPRVYGDSIGYGLLSHNPSAYTGSWGPQGTDVAEAVPGRNTDQVLARLNRDADGSYNGPIVVSTGASNEMRGQAPGTVLNDKQLATIQKQIDKAQKIGNGKVTLLGVGSRAGFEDGQNWNLSTINPQLKKLVDDTNARNGNKNITWGGPLPARVHPGGGWYTSRLPGV